MPNGLTVDLGNGSSFDAVSNGTITQQGTGAAATISFTGTGWVIVQGTNPSVKTTQSASGSTGSKILVENFAAVGGQPSTTRYLLVEASGGGWVSPNNSNTEYQFSAGQCIDVVNSNPPSIGSPQTYSATNFPGTASTLSTAEAALADYQS